MELLRFGFSAAHILHLAHNLRAVHNSHTAHNLWHAQSGGYGGKGGIMLPLEILIRKPFYMHSGGF